LSPVCHLIFVFPVRRRAITLDVAEPRSPKKPAKKQQPMKTTSNQAEGHVKAKINMQTSPTRAIPEKIMMMDTMIVQGPHTPRILLDQFLLRRFHS
jgi:hypothetical protein